MAQDTILTTAFVPGSLNSLDPLEASSADELTMVSLLCDGLLHLSMELDELSLSPALASEWTVSDDGLIYTFYLLQEANFADGSPLTAESVAFTFDQMMESDSLSSSAALLRDLIENVEILDEYSVSFKLIDSEEIGTFLFGLSQPAAAILAPHVENVSENPLCIGPFTLEVESGGVILLSNAGYYGELSPVDMIIFNEMSAEEQVNAYLDGALDVVDVGGSFGLDVAAVLARLEEQGLDSAEHQIDVQSLEMYLEARSPESLLSPYAKDLLGTVYTQPHRLLLNPDLQAAGWWCFVFPWCHPVDPNLP